MKKEWQTKRLGDVCEIIKGRKPALKATATNGDLPYLVAKVMRGSKEAEYASVKDRNSITVEESETIIICDGSNSGEVFTGFRGILSSTMGKIAKKAEIDDDYLRAFLASTFDVFNGAKTGAAIPHLDKEAMYQLQFPFPPLAEQQRIVGLLDEAFAGLATAKANAEKNLQNARALFESHLQSVFTQRGPGWKATTLGPEIDLLAGFAFKSAQYTSDDDDIRLLRGDNIIQGCLRWDDVKRWPADDTGDYVRYQLEEGDVVLAMDRPWVKAGLKHATISADDLPCLLVQRTARLRGGANLDNRFLKLLIGSSAFTGHILGVQTGIGVPHISGQQIKDFEFARPPLAEQRRIADNLESLREETQRLARIYERKLAALAELKKSLLHQAFTGEL